MTLLLVTMFRSALGSSLHTPTPLHDNVLTPRRLISARFDQNSTLSRVERGRSPVVLISLGRPQHF